MKFELKLPERHIRLGEISGLHGVQGWVKVFSNTEPRENIFSYSPWRVFKSGVQGNKVSSMEVLHWRRQGKTLVAKLKDLDDREEARELIGAVIAIEEAQLPDLGKNEFYWHQLVNMTVVTQFDGLNQELGQVVEMIETGANDVMIVRSENREHLVPWVYGQFVMGVDLVARRIDVDWDPDF